VSHPCQSFFVGSQLDGKHLGCWPDRVTHAAVGAGDADVVVER
jgi:hypothetical protein